MLKKLVTFSIFFTLVTQSIISEVKANTNYDYLIHINESFDKHPIHLMRILIVVEIAPIQPNQVEVHFLLEVLFHRYNEYFYARRL